MQRGISVRGRTIIPAEIRRELGITSDDVLDWKNQDGAILVQVLPRDPLRASPGILQGKGSVDEFLVNRAEERRLESVVEAKR